MEVVFAKENAFVKHPETGKVIMVAKRLNNLYCFQDNEAENFARMARTFRPFQQKRFKGRKKKVSGIKAKPDGKLPICETCLKGKQVQNTYPKSNSTKKNLLELVIQMYVGRCV